MPVLRVEIDGRWGFPDDACEYLRNSGVGSACNRSSRSLALCPLFIRGVLLV